MIYLDTVCVLLLLNPDLLVQLRNLITIVIPQYRSQVAEQLINTVLLGILWVEVEFSTVEQN